MPIGETSPLRGPRTPLEEGSTSKMSDTAARTSSRVRGESRNSTLLRSSRTRGSSTEMPATIGPKPSCRSRCTAGSASAVM